MASNKATARAVASPAPARSVRPQKTRRAALASAPEVGATVRPRGSEGHGRRLTAAFEALEAFPALAEARTRLMAIVGESHPAVSDIVAAVESDIALVIVTLRAANKVVGRGSAGVESVVDAVAALTPDAVERLVARMRTFDFFERTALWNGAPERFRLHGLATRAAVDRVASEVDTAARDRLAAAALLHDIGKLVLMHTYSGYPASVHREARTPEERIHNERRELGLDHALVGGVLARRWGLPRSLASAIERHHAEDAGGDAAIVRLADMLVHYTHGDTVSPSELLKVARRLGIDPKALRGVMFDLPNHASEKRRHPVEACPLSARELEVLKRLAKGMVYKQIAGELSLSTSTVRTHLHNIYGKLGAVDRAQAVLLAAERGWL